VPVCKQSSARFLGPYLSARSRPSPKDSALYLETLEEELAKAPERLERELANSHKNSGVRWTRPGKGVDVGMKSQCNNSVPRFDKT